MSTCISLTWRQLKANALCLLFISSWSKLQIRLSWKIVPHNLNCLWLKGKIYIRLHPQLQMFKRGYSPGSNGLFDYRFCLIINKKKNNLCSCLSCATAAHVQLHILIQWVNIPWNNSAMISFGLLWYQRAAALLTWFTCRKTTSLNLALLHACVDVWGLWPESVTLNLTCIVTTLFTRNMWFPKIFLG